MSDTPRTMALETIPIGLRYRTVEYTLDSTVLDEFYLRAGVPDPARLTLPDGRQAVPPSALSADYAKLIFQEHIAKDVAHYRATHEFVRPIIAPATVRVSGEVTNTFIRRGKEFFEIAMEITDASGDLLMRSKNEYWMNARVRHHEDGASEEATR